MLYLFDLDGTLISSYMDEPGRAYHTWHILPGRQRKLAELQRLGHTLKIVSNQAGVAFGHITEQDVISKFGQVAQALGYSSICLHDRPQQQTRYGAEAPALECHVCYSDARSKKPRYRDPADAARRKPSGAMISEALAQHGSLWGRDTALFVGDRPEDQAAAGDAGVSFEWADRFFAG